MVVKHRCGEDGFTFSLHTGKLLKMRSARSHTAIQRIGISSVEPRYDELQLSALYKWLLPERAAVEKFGA